MESQPGNGQEAAGMEGRQWVGAVRFRSGCDQVEVKKRDEYGWTPSLLAWETGWKVAGAIHRDRE